MAITGTLKYGRSLAFLTESSIVLLHDNGGEPHSWPQETLSLIGTNDEFVRQFGDEFMELVGAVARSKDKQDEIKDAIARLLVEGLLPAYERLREIRFVNDKQIATMNRRQLFEAFSGALWIAYKSLMPRPCKLLGFDIGFMFGDDSTFERGASAFKVEHPGEALVVEFLRFQRTDWQNDLADFRNNFVEHRNSDRDEFARYYELSTAEELFEKGWKSMADILPVFIAANFAGAVRIEEIPDAERDPNTRRRFRWVMHGVRLKS